MKRALITGATGFIGKHLVKSLVDDGWVVAVVVRTSSTMNELYELVSPNAVKVFHYDGTLKCLCDCFSEFAADVVFHLASCFISEHKPSDIDQLISSNILFGVHLLEAMSLSRIKLLVNTGTSWQHYNDEKYNPVSLYAATKQAYEDILLFYTNSQKIKAITLELFDTYGPKDNRKKLFGMLKKASETKKFIDFSPGKQMINLVYIDDVVAAFKLAAIRLINRSNCYEKYVVNSDRNIQLCKLVSLYMKVKQVNININWGARSYRLREVMKPYARGKRLPGWVPLVGLREGLLKI